MAENPTPSNSKRSYPWLEIALIAILVFMVFSSINAFYGQNIRHGVEQVCTDLNLWCAPPTPTPTVTPTPTLTPTVTTLPSTDLPESTTTPTPPN